MQVVDRQRRDLHYVANVQQVHPLALVQVAEEDAHVDRVGLGLVRSFCPELLLLLDDPVGLVRIRLLFLFFFPLLLPFLSEGFEVAVERLSPLRI